MLRKEEKMPYDEGLAQRIREKVEDVPGVSEMKAFGGLSFLINGNMAVGVIKEDLIVRVGPEKYEAALASPSVKPFDMTGRPLKGWIMVSPQGHAEDQDLSRWVEQGIAFAQSLPPK
jgi:TfoX/Sxy family transcriptional regulator of competence genes